MRMAHPALIRNPVRRDHRPPLFANVGLAERAGLAGAAALSCADPDHHRDGREIGRHQHEILRHANAGRRDARNDRLDAAEQQRADKRRPRRPAREHHERDRDPAAAAGHAGDPELDADDGNVAAGEPDQRGAGDDGAITR